MLATRNSWWYWSDVSVAMNFHIVEFVSNFIKHECNAIISKRYRCLIFFSLSIFFRRENFRTATYINSAAVWVFISRRYPNVGIWIVRVSLNLYNAFVKNWLVDIQKYSRYQPFCTMKPNDFKSAMLDLVNFFLGVVSSLKDVFLVCFGYSFSISVSR